MDQDSISPEEFHKLKMKVDILQRFLTKTFGSSFLDFCKETRLALTKGAGQTNKPVPALNKTTSSQGSIPNGKNVKLEVEANGKSGPGASPSSSSSIAARRPPPLLHRPIGSAGINNKNGGGVGVLTISAGTSRGSSNVAVAGGSGRKNPVVVTAAAEVEEPEEGEGEPQIEFYEEGNEEDVVQFIQPETVFSDDEQQQTLSHPATKSVSGNRTNGSLKRDHSAAFGYEENENAPQDKMQLPEGTECIIIDSDADQGQQENYTFQQEDDDDMYETADPNNDEEYYDEEGYSYNMVEDGLEVTGNGTGNYSTEELHTDGNVTFGTVITAQDTGIQYFQCSFCPSANVFKHKQSLKEHYLLNHSPTPPAFQCQCGRRFLKQRQLKRHEVVHTAERPYVCPICLKDFTRKDNMTVHMVRNHAEKKHPCPYCPDKIYATPAEVNRHLRMYHSQWQQ